MIQPLGIDNVFFEVDDLDVAIAFYEGCGFRLKARVEKKGVAVLTIGTERPGLVLRRGAASGGRLWVEVSDATAVAADLEARGIDATRLETATGLTLEVSDPSGNRVGFADYSRMPRLARPPRGPAQG